VEKRRDGLRVGKKGEGFFLWGASGWER